MRPSAPGVLIDPSAEVAADAAVGPRAVVSAGCRVEPGPRSANRSCSSAHGRRRRADERLDPRAGAEVGPGPTVEGAVAGPRRGSAASAMLDHVLAIPEHLRDALWRVESARIAPADSEGLLVCGMGGSAIGGDLAAAVLGDRLERPLETVRDYAPPSWAGAGVDRALLELLGRDRGDDLLLRGRRGARLRRIVASTGGKLVEMARSAGAPVIGLPGLIPSPRFGAAYMLVCAAEAAALAGVAPRIARRSRPRRRSSSRAPGTLRSRAAEIAAALGGSAARHLRRRPDRPGRASAGRPRSTRTRSCPRSSPSCPRPTTTTSAAGPGSRRRGEARRR